MQGIQGYATLSIKGGSDHSCLKCPGKTSLRSLPMDLNLMEWIRVRKGHGSGLTVVLPVPLIPDQYANTC